MERIQEKAHDNKEFSCESSKPRGESGIPTRERDRERQRERISKWRRMTWKKKII